MAVGDLAYLNGKLDTALGDTSDTVWASAEKDDLLTWAVAMLWPRVSRPLDPDSNAIALDDDVFFYPLNPEIMAVSRVDWLDEDGFVEHGQLDGGSWSVEGNPLEGSASLRVDPGIVASGGVLRLYAYGKYDLVTGHRLPVPYIPEVLAMARAEAWRRVAGDRARFQTWLSRQQTQNVSVNELLQFVNEADSEARRLKIQNKVFQRPVPGRA